MMDAGRELDAVVAEKVMGWVWATDEGVSVLANPDAPGLAMGVTLGKTGTPDYDARLYAATRLPEYSTDIAAAWEVVEKLDLFGNGSTLTNDDDGVWLVKDWTELVIAAGDTAPLAICLAALAAVDSPEDHYASINYGVLGYFSATHGDPAAWATWKGYCGA